MIKYKKLAFIASVSNRLVLFCSRPNFLDELARTSLLRRLIINLCSMSIHNAGEGVFFHSLTMLFPSFKNRLIILGKRPQPFVALLPFWRHIMVGLSVNCYVSMLIALYASMTSTLSVNQNYKNSILFLCKEMLKMHNK